MTEAPMRFMVPHGRWRRAWRNLVLRASVRSRWFRRRVNSGRLAEPFTYPAPPGPEGRFPRHGAVAPDGPLEEGRLRDRIGRGFVLLLVGAEPPPVGVGCEVVVAGPELARRYGSEPRAWLIRPDGHIADSLPLTSDAAPAELPAWVTHALPPVITRSYEFAALHGHSLGNSRASLPVVIRRRVKGASRAQVRATHDLE